ncbi:MAG: DUF2789 domain-containing protein [Moraxellaceae bacterium]|nr:DUF2789 domain-containing protein [Moraxellaceae bacterium]MDZ4386122.1 DUF2789 domain-containing protein [Moraxellaceae bacterium]
MDTNLHTFSELFDQLGLPSDADSIERFIGKHRPLPDDIFLVNAPFWSAGQRNFLREVMVQDSDWVGLVDQLNAQLRTGGD